MKTAQFPYIALGLGIFLMGLVLVGSQATGDGSTVLPLFTLLAACELAFFITTAGAVIGGRQMLTVGLKPIYAAVTLVCSLLALRFLFLGIEFWPL